MANHDAGFDGYSPELSLVLRGKLQVEVALLALRHAEIEPKLQGLLSTALKLAEISVGDDDAFVVALPGDELGAPMSGALRELSLTDDVDGAAADALLAVLSER